MYKDTEEESMATLWSQARRLWAQGTPTVHHFRDDVGPDHNIHTLHESIGCCTCIEGNGGAAEISLIRKALYWTFAGYAKMVCLSPNHNTNPQKAGMACEPVRYL